jgi:6-phosphogluconolactonase
MDTAPTAGFPGELRLYDDAGQLAGAAAELFIKAASDSISARGRFRVALSGGSTPRRMYKLLATTALSGRVAWDRVDAFFGDERYLPSDDPDSNYRMTDEALLRHIPVAPGNIHRVRTEISPPRAAAAAYEHEIRECFAEAQAVPQFDLIYLGIGTNGHTASLFPHSPALKEHSRLVLADWVPEVKNWRISMSAPLLNRGRTVAFLVQGQEKAQVLRDILLGSRDPERLPAQLIAPEGKLLWLTDAAAAALLPKTGHERRVA